MSEYKTAWLVFDPDGEILYRFTSQDELLAWNNLIFAYEKRPYTSDEDFHDLVAKYKSDGYRVKQIEWRVKGET